MIFSEEILYEYHQQYPVSLEEVKDLAKSAICFDYPQLSYPLLYLAMEMTKEGFNKEAIKATLKGAIEGLSNYGK